MSAGAHWGGVRPLELARHVDRPPWDPDTKPSMCLVELGLHWAVALLPSGKQIGTPRQLLEAKPLSLPDCHPFLANAQHPLASLEPTPSVSPWCWERPKCQQHNKCLVPSLTKPPDLPSAPCHLPCTPCHTPHPLPSLSSVHLITSACVPVFTGGCLHSAGRAGLPF